MICCVSGAHKVPLDIQWSLREVARMDRLREAGRRGLPGVRREVRTTGGRDFAQPSRAI